MNRAPNTVTPNPLQSHFYAGLRAFDQGIFDNPHQFNSLPYKEWERGWNVGYFQNLKKVISSERQMMETGNV